jgi:membrane protease YdiL (CAAX protease family)
MCILFTPILLYFRQKSGSVIVAAIMHGTFNGVVGLSNIFVLPFNDLLVGAPGLAGMLVLLGSDAAIFLYDRYVTKERIFTSPI